MRIERHARFTVLSLILAAASLSAGCGGDGDAVREPIPGVPATATGRSTAPASATRTPVSIPDGAPLIDQRGLAFIPGKIAARVGETVYFLNGDPAPHTVSINGRNISGVMARGDVATWKSGVAGEYQVTCAFHFDMRATITVQ